MLVLMDASCKQTSDMLTLTLTGLNIVLSEDGGGVAHTEAMSVSECVWASVPGMVFRGLVVEDTMYRSRPLQGLV